MKSIEQLLNKNILIAGCTGYGKSYLLHTIVESIKNDKSFKTAQIYVDDPKSIEFSKAFRNKDVLKYDESEIFKLITLRAKYLIENNAHSFDPIFVIFDELAERMPYLKDGEEYFERKSLLTNPIIDICSLELCNSTNVHIIAATQLPSRLTIKEIKSKFNLYIEPSQSNDERYEPFTSLLEKKLEDHIKKIETIQLNERVLNLYSIQDIQ